MSTLSAERELPRLIERYEENPTGRAFAPLADSYRKLGRLDEALRLCREGLSHHPRYSSAYVILAKIYLDRGEPEVAHEAFVRVLAIDPQNLVALRHVAQHAQEHGDAALALRTWEHLATADPESQEAHDQVARLRAALGAARLGAGDAPAAQRQPPAPPAATSRAVAPAPEILTALSRDESLSAPPVVPPPHAAPAAAIGASSVASAASAAVQRTANVAHSAMMAANQSATEIATITLADIYSEQGFKAKALEVYRSVCARAPHRAAELAERVARIEAELRALEAMETRLRAQSAASVPGERAAAAPAAPAAPGSAPGAASGDLPATAAPTAAERAHGDSAAEPKDFDQFQTWLKKIKLRNS